MAKQSKMAKFKALPWALITLVALCVLNLALILDYTIIDFVGKIAFNEVGFNNSLIVFTYICNIAFIVIHILLLFIKDKSKSMLYILASAGMMIIFYIIRFCLVWF